MSNPAYFPKRILVGEAESGLLLYYSDSGSLSILVGMTIEETFH